MHLNQTLQDEKGLNYFKENEMSSGYMPPQINFKWGFMKSITDILEMVLLP